LQKHQLAVVVMVLTMLLALEERMPQLILVVVVEEVEFPLQAPVMLELVDQE
jgi:hypothetical protein|tara:strand:- start:524 stop:679 length:156 start_codon:yes stop_codon:yes gene_type:complete